MAWRDLAFSALPFPGMKGFAKGESDDWQGLSALYSPSMVAYLKAGAKGDNVDVFMEVLLLMADGASEKVT